MQKRSHSTRREPYKSPKVVLKSKNDAEENENYIANLPCLYNNKGNISPSLYSSLKYTVLPSLKLSVPDSHAKQIVYRSLFKNCYSNAEDEGFLGKLSLFHDHFQNLCDNVYPFTRLKEAFLNRFATMDSRENAKDQSRSKDLIKDKSKSSAGKLPKILHRSPSNLITQKASKRLG